MTATQSQTTTTTARRNPFWINLRFRVQENKKLFIAYSVLQLFGLPLMALVGMLMLYERGTIAQLENGLSSEIPIKDYYWYVHGEMYLLLGGLCCGLAMLIGLMFIFRSFDYLSKKSRVDMTLALPVTTRQRFWSDFCAGFAMYAIPLLAATALAFAICGIGAAVIDNPYEMEGEWGVFFAGCGNGVIYVLLGMFSLYVFAALACVCCGTQTETPLTAIALYALPPIVALAAAQAFFIDAFGVNTESVLMKILNFMGPVGACSAAFQFLDSVGEDISMGALTLMTLKWALPFLLGNAALLGLTRYLYGRRKAEDTAKPFVYRLIYYIIMTAAVFCVVGVCILSGGTFEEYLPILFFVGLVYLLIETVVNRGFKKLYWGALRFVCSVGAVFVFSAVLEATHFFGIETRVPDADAVKSVQVTIHASKTDVGRLHAKLTDEQAIALITQTHQTIIDRFLSDSPVAARRRNKYGSMAIYDYDNQVPDDRREEVAYLDVTYQLKSGATMERNYDLNDAEWTKLLELWTIPETCEKAFDDATDSYRREAEALHEACSFYIGGVRCTVTNDELERIRESYLADSRNLTVNAILYGNVVCSFANLPLFNGVHDNTLQLLSDLALWQREDWAEQIDTSDTGSVMLLSPTLIAELMDDESIWYSGVWGKLQEKWLACTTEAQKAELCQQICWISSEDVKAISSDLSNSLKQADPCWCVFVGSNLTYYARTENAQARVEQLFADAQKATADTMELAMRQYDEGIDRFAFESTSPLQGISEFTSQYCWSEINNVDDVQTCIDEMLAYYQTGEETELLTAVQEPGNLPLGATTLKELCEKIVAAWEITHPA